MSPLKSTVTGILALLALQSPVTMGVELQEGKWGVTTITSAPMSPAPVEKYEENCVVETSFNPVEEMLDQQMASMCDVTVNADTDTNLDADLRCNMQGAGTMNGKLAFTVSGNSASGLIDMSMSFNGQTMSMNSKWDATYLGACD